ncbi:hypothetical protein ACJ77P_01610 [Syntrophus buswellii]|nr:hypothetical protein [Syntrophus sp. (in: bacteria)]
MERELMLHFNCGCSHLSSMRSISMYLNICYFASSICYDLIGQ